MDEDILNNSNDFNIALSKVQVEEMKKKHNEYSRYWKEIEVSMVFRECFENGHSSVHCVQAMF